MSRTPTLAKAVAVAVPAIAILLSALFGFSYALTVWLGLPLSLNFPSMVRGSGAVIVALGLFVAGWVFRYRSPATMIVSTYATFTKLFGRVPLAASAGRTEPLIIVGPQKYVRNPLYFGVLVVAFGLALVGSYTFSLVGVLFLLLWFRLLLIPFEEKELLVLFGEQYKRYSAEVPMLVPFTKRKR